MRARRQWRQWRQWRRPAPPSLLWPVVVGILVVGSVNSWAGVSGTRGGSSLAGHPVGAMFGTNQHFTSDWNAEHIQPVMHDCGIQWMRSDFWWSRLEPANDTWDPTFVTYCDHVVANTSATGIHMLALLSYGTHWANPNSGYRHNTFPYALDDWRDYCGFVARRWGGNASMGYYEIYNEPNHDHSYWVQNATTLREFAELTIAAAETIKGIDPTARVLGPGVSNTGVNDYTKDASPNFLQVWYDNVNALSRGNFSGLFDGFCCHPYGNVEFSYPERLRTFKEWVETKRVADGKDYLLLVTETGDNTAPPGGGYLTQAQIVAKEAVLSAHAGYDVHINYELVDGRTPPRDWQFNVAEDEIDGEHVFGLVERDLTPKPSYHAYKACIALLTGSYQLPHVVEAPLAGKKLQCCAFTTRAGELALAYWSNERATPRITVRFPAGESAPARDLYEASTNYSRAAAPGPTVPCGPDLRVVVFANTSVVTRVTIAVPATSVLLVTLPVGLFLVALYVVLGRARRRGPAANSRVTVKKNPKKKEGEQEPGDIA